MRDLLGATGAWFDAGRPFALATVVRTWSSSPRQPGASMAVDVEGEVLGSVSGGCVEGAVYEVARQVLATGSPALETYGVSDDDAFAVGLTCGGVVQVFVERVDHDTFPGYGRLRDLVAQRRGLAVATVIEGGAVGGGAVGGGAAPGHHLLVRPGSTQGGLGAEGLDADVSGQALALLGRGRTAVVRAGAAGRQPADHRPGDEVAVFVESMAPPPTMLVYGAVDFAAALVRAAKLLGYHVVVCDARAVFATAARFAEADEVVVAWPHEHLAATVEAGGVDARTAVCVLTHDARFDVPLLALALRGEAAYVGAMGSRATHDDRVARLRALGLGAELDRLSSPIGLDLGARTPQETAVSILAEVIATTWGGTGQRLRDLDAPIHR